MVYVHKEKERGIRVYLTKDDLRKYDLENAPLTLVDEFIKRGKDSYYMEKRIKDLESFLSGLSDKFDRLIHLSCEMFDLLSHSSNVDHFEIERLKFYHENGKKLTQEQVSMVKVAEAKEENFRIFLKKLFPEVNPEVFKLMTRHDFSEEGQS